MVLQSICVCVFGESTQWYPWDPVWALTVGSDPWPTCMLGVGSVSLKVSSETWVSWPGSLACLHGEGWVCEPPGWGLQQGLGLLAKVLGLPACAVGARSVSLGCERNRRVTWFGSLACLHSKCWVHEHWGLGIHWGPGHVAMFLDPSVLWVPSPWAPGLGDP